MTDTSNPSTGQTLPCEIVYGVLEGTQELVFLPIDRARELAILHIALRTSHTWGEFWAILPSRVYAQVVEHLRENDVEPGENADPFVREDIWGYSDGDWPGWPAQEMLAWLPQSVQQVLGTEKASVINGPYLALDASQRVALVVALQTEGYCCTQDNTLVRLACGY